ncbi:MAG: GxxExxY protein [Deferribacteres bacterium]|nr:GxxExxY protein [candidate division KSB1 bacterium]MCB9502194.1 GxxExxY protein [Deferribacteres bacterium]
MAELIYPVESYAIMGACFEVYKEMGCGYTEPVYQECLELEFGMQGIPVSSQEQIGLTYKNHELKKKFIPDFICFEKIILEIKTVSAMQEKHESQVLNYLNATGYKLGLLVNFAHYPKVEYKRLVNTKMKL